MEQEQSKRKAGTKQEPRKSKAMKHTRTLSVPYAKPGDGKRSLDRLGVVCQVVRPLWGEGGLEGEGRLRFRRLMDDGKRSLDRLGVLVRS